MVAGYQKPKTRKDFEVAIICALPLEYDAVTCAFDEFWDSDGDEYRRAAGDPNSYTTGRIGHYNVVLALLPHMGKVNAASAATSMRSSYTELRLVLLVGICGGYPVDGKRNLFLGDVVISETVLQYDFGRLYPDGFERKDTYQDRLGKPNKEVRNLLSILRTDRAKSRLEDRTAAILDEIQSTACWHKYSYPGQSNDQLFRSGRRHKHYKSTDCVCHYGGSSQTDPVCAETRTKSCDELGCVTEHSIVRVRSSDQPTQPAIHVGIVASGDMVLKSALDRDRLHKETGAIAFEMEGAGIWDEAPCIVVKAICDYADSHKNKSWQDYAAAVAAAAAKALLEQYIRTDKPIREEAEAVSTAASTQFHFNGNISAGKLLTGVTVNGGTANFNF